MTDAKNLLGVDCDIRCLARRSPGRLCTKHSTFHLGSGRLRTMNHDARVGQTVPFPPFPWIYRSGPPASVRRTSSALTCGQQQRPHRTRLPDAVGVNGRIDVLRPKFVSIHSDISISIQTCIWPLCQLMYTSSDHLSTTHRVVDRQPRSDAPACQQ